MSTSATPFKTLSVVQVLTCSALVLTLSMGIRHGFGLWMQPMTQENGWSRESFALAMAIQNIAWGIAGIFAGMVADRFGAYRVLVVGAVLYGLGLMGMANAQTPLMLSLVSGSAHWYRPSGDNLRCGLWRDWAQRASGAAILGHGLSRCRRVVRSVFNGSCWRRSH